MSLFFHVLLFFSVVSLSVVPAMGVGLDASSSDASDASGRLLGEIKYPKLWEVVKRLETLAQVYPDLVEMYSAQDRYGVPEPGASGCRAFESDGVTLPVPCKPCYDEHDAATPCKQWFVSISNRTAGAVKWASSSPATRDRPQVFLSGNLHGNEWIGPPTLLALAELMVGGATGTLGQDLSPWLSRLVNTRTIVMLIVSNPYGYENRVREDFNGIDPNRDFGYDREDEQCMSTTVGRAVNEDYLAHAYQVAVTFHAGMQEVSWEWGSHSASSNHNSVCPDAVASEAMGDTMRDIAGVFNEGPYPAGIINQDIYWVYGGMEDWSYAG